ncbi:hypothetical protein BDV93DRAFT_10007 [Ceratobasidium sp. AG-I]|nr:hypothetical protein BDV93DRAFT_10007 [Ceratobasidium sp. AG-I]
MNCFRKSNHLMTSAYRLSRQPGLTTRSFASASPRLHSLGIQPTLASRWNIPNAKPKYIGVGTITAAAVGLGLAGFASRKVYCDGVGPARGTPSAPSSTYGSDPLPPPPSSSLSLYELSFGSVAGVCAGVFIKKGAKMVAFFLGGVFVLLQYFNAIDITKVNWVSASSRFERLFYTPSATPGQESRAPTVGSLWTWGVDFLTADFPPRASFLAGLVLGLRLG